MHQFKFMALSVVAIPLLLSLTMQAFAAREARSEVNFLVPYAMGRNIYFDGGSSAKIDGDLGVGFGYAYNFTDNLAYRVDLTWNSSSYKAHRTYTEGADDVVGDLDKLSILFGSDYYFVKGSVAPYVNFNFGWTIIDSTLSHNPTTLDDCWNTPWSAQSCQGSSPRYDEKNMVAGVGLGLRFEIARRNFMRLGYYHEWVDFDQSTKMTGLGALRFEFGFLY